MIKNNDRFAEYKIDIHKTDTPAHFFQLVADFVDYAWSKSSVLKLVEGLEYEYQKAKDNYRHLEDIAENEVGVKTKSSGGIASFKNREKYFKSRSESLSTDWLKNEKLINSAHYGELQNAKVAFDEFRKNSSKWKSWKELVMVRDFVRRNGSSISLEEYEKQLDLGVRLIDVDKVINFSIEDIKKMYIPFFDNVYNYFADMTEANDGHIVYSNCEALSSGTLTVGSQEITFKKIPADILNFFYLYRVTEEYKDYHEFNSFSGENKKLTSDEFNKKIKAINRRIEKETRGVMPVLITRKENKQQEANLYKWNK